jgi:hypothetical protein
MQPSILPALCYEVGDFIVKFLCWEPTLHPDVISIKSDVLICSSAGFQRIELIRFANCFVLLHSSVFRVLAF